MKLFIFEWQKEVRLDCTAQIIANSKEEAINLWKIGYYKYHDESEATVLNEDSDPIIKESKDF
jgi:hypothetical protein